MKKSRQQNTCMGNGAPKLWGAMDPTAGGLSGCDRINKVTKGSILEKNITSHHVE